jgi:uncharacterized repeat protein (TIGR01451 family)
MTDAVELRNGADRGARSAPARPRARLSAGAFVALLLAVAPLEAQVCGTPGKDGPGGVLSGVVNTYFPGSTANLSAGATSVAVGAATGASVGIAPGDLVLIIQMQDAAINSNNSSAYGANDGSGSGATSLNSTGRYEYVTALSTVGLAGGTLTFRGTGAGNGLNYSYTNAAATGSQGQRRYQVVRVPQYSSATLSSGLTASAWNGASGGILALDIAGTLSLGGTVSVDAKGFRGGGGRQLTGGSGGSNSDYRNLATYNFHGSKGEGIAGTPRYVVDAVTAALINNGTEGYPNGSTARGAPGNAGGGGNDGRPSANDENSGGGGGGNAGAGGRGGNSWNSNLAVGGRGGAAVPAAAGLIVLGGGGGAGTRNNSSGTASSGGAGGGIVMIRAGSVTGVGTITANGQVGNTPANDGGGGGGAGGSVVVYAATGGLAGLTVQARGGDGGNADVGGVAHGPGGGGGGGFVALSGAASVDVSGGSPGYTISPGNLFNATAGSSGSSVATLTAGQMPGTSPGAACVPALTVTKTTSTPSVVNSPTGTTATYTILVSNAAGRDTARSVTLSDTLPAGFTFASNSPPVFGGGASRPSTTNPAVGAAVPAWGTFSIPGGGSVSLTFVVTVPAAVPNGTYQNPARATYLDPARTAAGGTTSASYVPSSSTGEDVTVITLSVSVTPDGGQNLQQLPSNGTNYTFTFTVTNTGTASSSFGLKAFPRPGTAVGIVSVNGVAGDTTNVTIAAGAGQAIAVAYTLGVVASGMPDSLWLRATAAAASTNRDTGFADLTVVRPALQITKGVAPTGVQLPGTDLTYTVGVTNVGGRAAVNAVAVDSLSPAVQFKLGTVVNTLPPGVNVTVSYSNDGGASWIYVPVSLGCGAPAGYDGCVNRIRWTLLNNLSAVAPNNTCMFQYVARIK